MRICGIDPGVTGALALLDSDGSLLEVADIPTLEVQRGKTRRHRIDAVMLAALLREWAPDHAVVEALNPRPSDGANSGRAAHAAELMRAAGIVEGVIAALGIPSTGVQPITWRRAMLCRGPVGDTAQARAGRKEASRQRAIALWPATAPKFLKTRPDRAEACLIARWGILAAGLGAIGKVAA